MAFTDAQRASIRLYLGWAGRWFQTDFQLEQAMDSATAETQALVVVELANCATADTAINSASLATHFKAASVGNAQGGIVLQGADELELLRNRGRQAAGRIAAMLGVGIRHDAFSAAGPRSGPNDVPANYMRQG
jgi:putative ubiquitin-RnfH superfamily antitoxin RatB of RatAB toxin-antitoxin module